MAIALVSNAGTSGASTSTTAAIDTTGATLLVANIAGFTAAMSDSKGNTWTALTPAGTNAHSTLYYAANPGVGPGHTFTFTGSGVACALQVQAFSGVALSPFDQQSGTGGGTAATGQNPGSITASVPNELFVSGYQKENGSADVYSVTSSFIITDQSPFQSGVKFGGALAYKIASGSEDPFWIDNHGTTGRNGATMATFLPDTGAVVQPVIFVIT